MPIFGFTQPQPTGPEGLQSVSLVNETIKRDHITTIQNFSSNYTTELEKPPPNGDFGIDVRDLERAANNGAAEGLGTWGFGFEGNSNSEPAGLFPPRSGVDAPHRHLEDETASPRSDWPFRSWIKNIRRRAADRSAVTTMPDDSLPRHDIGLVYGLPARTDLSRHSQSSSESSFDCVAAIKSASISVGSKSQEALPEEERFPRNPRPGRSSHSGGGTSEDNILPDTQSTMDAAAASRSLTRGYILEELLATEKDYVVDLRSLINVYSSIQPTTSNHTLSKRASIKRNLAEIIELHDEILAELRRVLPRDGPSLQQASEQSSSPNMIDDAHVVADVARVFNKRVHRLFIYEEYGARYDMMAKDIKSATDLDRDHDRHLRGNEVLASSMGSAIGDVDRGRKSLTMKDLLIKPIQRMTRYPLLFSELLKYTPIVDCPNSHLEIVSAFLRMQKAANEMNRATDDVHFQGVIEKTKLLRRGLVFPEKACKDRIHSFGHIQLCGVLHVCWQTRETIEGRYMGVMLYRNILCLTLPSPGKLCTIQACISLADVKIEEADNGRGLQCHGAPFTWKIVFEHKNRLYEFVMTACTAKEEREWKSHLGRLVTQQSFHGRDPDHVNFLALNAKSLAAVFGRPGTLARRMSVHRTMSSGPATPSTHVILKGTTLSKGAYATGIDSGLGRSKSVIGCLDKCTVLAPPRSERAALEAHLADFWTRETLPFPGMTTRTWSDKMARSSASTLMRRLSVASITSSFSSKRPASESSLSRSVSKPNSPQRSAHTGPSPANSRLDSESTASRHVNETPPRMSKRRPRREDIDCPTALGVGAERPVMGIWPVFTPEKTVMGTGAFDSRRSQAGAGVLVLAKSSSICNGKSPVSPRELSACAGRRQLGQFPRRSAPRTVLPTKKEQLLAIKAERRFSGMERAGKWSGMTSIKDILSH